MSTKIKINDNFYKAIKEATKSTIDALRERLEFKRELQNMVQDHNRQRLTALKNNLGLKITDRADFIIAERAKSMTRLKSRWWSKPKA
jgi:hypothetical protein